MRLVICIGSQSNGFVFGCQCAIALGVLLHGRCMMHEETEGEMQKVATDPVRAAISVVEYTDHHII